MASAAQHSGPCCPVLELRRYTVQPGAFDTLLGLFQRTFIAEQEAVGMHLVGFFRQVGRPEQFVWVRGFDGLTQRHAAYAAFYDGPIWKELRDATNATLVDSSDVLLLRPVDGRGFLRGPMPEATKEKPGTGRIVASLLFFPAPVDAAQRQAVGKALDGTRLESVAVLESESGKNTWTRHPVRTGENVLVGFSWVDGPRVEQAVATLGTALGPFRARRETLVLEPVSCSRVR